MQVVYVVFTIGVCNGVNAREGVVPTNRRLFVVVATNGRIRECDGKRRAKAAGTGTSTNGARATRRSQAQRWQQTKNNSSGKSNSKSSRWQGQNLLGVIRVV